MKLECIGFYTLCDERAANVNMNTPLWRCELILTDACNFRCPYCRGIRNEFKGSLSFDDAMNTVTIWTKEKLKNIRFSGGEPTLWKGLGELVKYTKSRGVERIALSTNGSADHSYYDYLIECGVDDFSISLDACCSSTGDLMAGGINGAWNHVIENIKYISKKKYTTVGVVLTPENINEFGGIVEFASTLGVNDIRIIPSAQWNGNILRTIPNINITKYPILNYRINNLIHGKKVRSITKNDNHKCPLVLDDMAVLANYHFPCIIYLREGGSPIGKMNDNVRQERYEWFLNHNSYENKICKNNCLDVCVDYNNKVKNTNNFFINN